MKSNRIANIIIIHEYGFINGGSAKIAIETAIELARRDYKVTYFCACGPIDESLVNTVDTVVCINQFDVLNNPSKIEALGQGIWNKKALQELSRILNGCNKDNTVVNIHGFSHALSASIFKACYKNGIRPYLTIHDYFCVCPNGGFYNYKKQKICHNKPMSIKCILCNCDSRSLSHKIFRVIRQVIIDKYVRNNPDVRYIYISNFSYSKIKSYLKSNESYYLHNPIDKINCGTVYPDDKKCFAYIGRFSAEKGVDLFCRAMHNLKLKAIAVGNGPLKQQLEEKYNDFINFTGWQSKNEIEKLLPKIKCLVFPSKWYEVAPLTPEECLSIGIPCIVSDECAASEYIEDGVNGYVFKSGNIKDLEDKILYFKIENCPIREPIRMKEYLDNMERIIENYNEEKTYFMI